MLRGGTQVARESASRFITWIITNFRVHGGEVGRFRRRRRPWVRRWGRALLGLARLLTGADPEVAVAGGPSAAALANAFFAAALVRDAGERAVLDLPRAHPRLRHAAAVV